MGMYRCTLMPTRSLRDADLADLTIRRAQDRDTREGSPPRRHAIRWAVAVMFVFMIAGVGYWFLPSVHRSVEQPVYQIPSPLTPTISSTPPAVTPLSASGYVVAQRQASVASKGTGRLEHLGVAVGDQVKEGRVLARLEHTDVDALLRQTQARLGIAKAVLTNSEADLTDATLAYNRSKTLLAQQFVTQAEYDSAKVRLHRAQAAVRSAKAGVLAALAEVQAAEVQVENTHIRAPFDGTVLKKFAEVGEVVAPLAASASSRGAVFLIADLTSLQVEAEVSETMIGRVHMQQQAEITLDAIPGQRYRGEVVQILPTADRSKATVLVKVRILDLDPRVLPEMSAKVVFLSTQAREGG